MHSCLLSYFLAHKAQGLRSLPCLPVPKASTEADIYKIKLNLKYMIHGHFFRYRGSENVSVTVMQLLRISLKSLKGSCIDEITILEEQKYTYMSKIGFVYLPF